MPSTSFWYIWCEDLATAFVGPFFDLPSVVDHLKYMTARQDGGHAVPMYIHKEELQQLAKRFGVTDFYTPEQDRSYKMDD